MFFRAAQPLLSYSLRVIYVGADILLFLKSKYGIIMLDSDANRFCRAVGGFLPAKDQEDAIVVEEGSSKSGWLENLNPFAAGRQKEEEEDVHVAAVEAAPSSGPATEEEVKEDDNCDDDDEEKEAEDPLYLDIVQMLSMLIIPQLLMIDDKESSSNADQDVVQTVLSSFLASVGGKGSEEVELSEALVWNLLMSKGETKLAEDKELVKSMVVSDI